MSVGAGLALALLSAFALNWGWLEQHGATQAMPALSGRRPVQSLRLLFGDRTWLVGFVVGLAGWAFYVAALALAPLSLVQATSAGGIGILAALAHRRGHAAQWPAVGVAVAGLALLAVSLAGGTPKSTTVSPAALLVWLSASALFAVLFGARGSGAALGLAAGTLYAAGDVGTKAAVHGGAWLLVVPVVLAAHGAAFVALQLGFQRGTPLATAGTSTLLTNALPIAAGIALFHERLPGGALGALRVVAFASVVVAAAMLARQPSETTRSAIATTEPALPRNSAS
ncbi:MAG TPA: hypothetical protein VGO39_09595 [Gaiellaceae bacterium]|nr:hypothetical protein [Gaiellaceae bacterium]